MDYRALAELVIFGLLGLSILTLAIGFTVRTFFAPLLRELFGRPPQDTHLLTTRLARMEDRLESIEGSLSSIEQKTDFDRKLEGPKAG